MDKHIDATQKKGEVPWDDLRLRRNWDNIEQKLKIPVEHSRPIRWWTYGLSGATAVLAAVFLFFIIIKPADSVSFNPFSDSKNIESSSLLVVDADLAKPKSNSKRVIIDNKTILTLVDGSRAEASLNASVRLVSSTPKEVSIIQQKGHVKYSVTKNKKREFIVRAHGVNIQVVGTKFTVTVLKNSSVFVQVIEGIVRASDNSRSVLLGIGESVTLLGDAREEKNIAVVQKTNIPNKKKNISSNSVSKTTKKPTPLTLKKMLSMVDIARKSGNSAKALKLLRKITSISSTNPNQVTAFFILARMEFSNGNFKASALAYRKYLNRSPRGTLAMDALAGEARARYKCGNKSRAKKLALEYIKRFPKSLHEARMKELLQ
jgi:FecR protein